MLASDADRAICGPYGRCPMNMTRFHQLTPNAALQCGSVDQWNVIYVGDTSAGDDSGRSDRIDLA